METPNPLISKGSALGRLNPKRRSKAVIAVFVVLAVHVVVVSVLLFVGCRHEQCRETTGSIEPTNQASAVATNLASVVTNLPAAPLAQTQTSLPPTSGVADAQSPILPPLEAPAAKPPTKEHTVAKGDSLWKIANANHISMKAVAEANPGIDPAKLKAGQVLQVPVAAEPTAAVTSEEKPSTETSFTTYVVKRGDTLGKIAKAHGTSIRAMRAANHLKSDRIVVGKKLKIPEPTSARSRSKTQHASATNAPRTL